MHTQTKNSKRSKLKQKTQTGRFFANTAQLARTVLIEGLGAAVLVFLFLTTRLTPEQLEQYSLNNYLQIPSVNGGTVLYAIDPARVDSTNSTNERRTPQGSDFQGILDTNSTYRVDGSSDARVVSGPLRPSWAQTDNSVSPQVSSSRRRRQTSSRSPKLNW